MGLGTPDCPVFKDMLQSTEWSGGLRDRVLPMDEQHCEAVETAVQATIRSLTRNVFKYHGI